MQTLPTFLSTAPFLRLVPTRRTLKITAIFVVCYVLLALLSRAYLIRPFGVTPWNPSAGLALGLLLIFGIRFWPALAIAACLANVLTRGLPAPPFFQLLMPFSVTVGYVGMAILLLGPLRFGGKFDRLRDVFTLVAVATAGTFVVAIAFVSAIRLETLMTDAEFQSIVLRSWVGHLIGVVINTPLLLMVASRPELLRRLRRRPSLEVMAQFCTVMASLWVVFNFRTIDSYNLFYLLFFPLIWITMRHAIVGAVLGISLIQCGLIVAVAHTDSRGGMAVTEFQFIMLALAVTGLFLGMAGTESRAANKALDKSESQLRVIVATAPDGILMTDVHGVVVAANPAASRILGCATGGLVGVCVHDFLPDYRRALQSGVVTEGVAIRHDGSQFPVELAVGKAGSDGAELSITIARDISRRRKLERKFGEQQVELARSARLAAAGEMAAALAHELHQPLAAIRNYVHVAQMLATTADTQELMGKVEREAVRAADVVRRLRDFFRRGVSQLECISVQQLIDGALAPMQEEVARQHITLKSAIAQNGVELRVDRVQIETVFHSLVSNAIEAISAEDPRVRRICVTAHNAQDGWMQCSVADTGAGVDTAIVDRLFDPFVTTKPAGIGMALAMSRSIIESHGGRLWVESSGEGGTEFCFLLPTVNAKGAAHGGQ